MSPSYTYANMFHFADEDGIFSMHEDAWEILWSFDFPYVSACISPGRETCKTKCTCSLLSSNASIPAVKCLQIWNGGTFSWSHTMVCPWFILNLRSETVQIYHASRFLRQVPQDRLYLHFSTLQAPQSELVRLCRLWWHQGQAHTERPGKIKTPYSLTQVPNHTRHAFKIMFAPGFQELCLPCPMGSFACWFLHILLNC